MWDDLALRVAITYGVRGRPLATDVAYVSYMNLRMSSQIINR